MMEVYVDNDYSEYSLLLEGEGDEKSNTNKSIPNEWIFDKADLCTVMYHWIEKDIAISYLAQMGGVEGIAWGIKSNIVSGLSLKQLESISIHNRKQKYGNNKVTGEENRSFCSFCYDETEDPILRLVILSAIITLIVNATNKQIFLIIESIIMLFLLFIFILSNAFVHWKVDKNINEFINFQNTHVNKYCFVIRNNQKTKILREDIVVGDVIILEKGMTIPADGIFIKGTNDLQANEASLTGETREWTKNRLNPFLMCGTNIVSGNGLMLCIAVGDNTELGQMLQKLLPEIEYTQLQERLETMGAKIGWIGILASFIIVVILFVNWGIIHWKHPEYIVLQLIIFGFGLVLITVPEEFSAINRIFYAYWMHSFSDKILIKHFNEFEKMAQVTNICCNTHSFSRFTGIDKDTIYLINGFISLSMNNYERYDYFPADITHLIANYMSLDPYIFSAVNECYNCNIMVRIITNENFDIAEDTALTYNILNYDNDNHIVMKRNEFKLLSDAEKDSKLPKLRLLTDCNQCDIEELIEWYKQRNDIVLFGGNYPMLLKQADIGFSINEMSNDMSQEASDVIIIDKNFVSVVDCIKWSRGLYNNIRKYIYFKMSLVFSLIIIVTICSFFGKYLNVFSVVQILWIYLIIYPFISFIIVIQKPQMDKALNTSFSDEFMTKTLMKRIFGNVFYQIIWLILTIVFGETEVLYVSDNSEHKTLLFNTFIWLQIFNIFNAINVNQTIFNGLKNYTFVGTQRIFWIVIIFIVLIHIISIQIIGYYAQLNAKLSWLQWVYCVCVGFGSVIWHQIIATIK